jgi:hypothetical protein
VPFINGSVREDMISETLEELHHED